MIMKLAMPVSPFSTFPRQRGERSEGGVAERTNRYASFSLTVLFRTCARLIVGVFLLGWLAGCATPQTQALLQNRSEQLPPRVELTGVPFHPQEIHQCGPASLSMVLNAGGAMASPQELTEQVYLPGREGSLQIEMLAAARRNGLIAYELAPELNDLLAEVAAGSPVLVLQNLALSWYPRWHYAVVIGYDLERAEIILRSGLERRQVVPLTTFEHTWKRSGYWGMLAMPPGQMPRTATESAYVASAVALEQAGHAQGAAAAYEAALLRWPTNLTARIGLGNAAYANHDFPRAENAYRQATLDHPESAIAFNNLAQTLADQQRYAEALIAAHQAVSLGGAEQASARDTLKQIEIQLHASESLPETDTSLPAESGN